VEREAKRAAKNAVNYAFPAPNPGSILARAICRNPGWVGVFVRNDGVGMAHLLEGSLGHGLLRSLVQKIRGEMDIHSDGGLAVTITFPDVQLNIVSGDTDRSAG
jgi:two-component sensor histidine kinase